MDGNFSSDHVRSKCPWDDVRLADGNAFMVGQLEYAKHLETAFSKKQVGLAVIAITLCFCSLNAE